VKLLSVQFLTDRELSDLRRQARQERKKQNERLLDMTGRDANKLLEADISAYRTKLALRDTGEEGYQGPALPRLTKDHFGPYEDEEGVALLVLARDVGQPVLARFNCEPSGRFEERLRQSAKKRGWKLNFFRLLYGYAAVRVSSECTPSESDKNFLKSLGISNPVTVIDTSWCDRCQRPDPNSEQPAERDAGGWGTRFHV
jgi:hypothetical protein